jgi:hypothetical protein
MDGNGVVHTRKVKKHHGLLHAITFAMTGGMSAPINAALIGKNLAYNGETDRRINTDLNLSRRKSPKASRLTSGHGRTTRAHVRPPGLRWFTARAS